MPPKSGNAAGESRQSDFTKSSDLRLLRRSFWKRLEALSPYRSKIREIHAGHSVAAYGPEFIDVMLEGVRQVIDRNGEGDPTLEWFGGTAFTHELSDGSLVLYTKDKL